MTGSLVGYFDLIPIILTINLTFLESGYWLFVVIMSLESFPGLLIVLNASPSFASAKLDLQFHFLPWLCCLLFAALKSSRPEFLCGAIRISRNRTYPSKQLSKPITKHYFRLPNFPLQFKDNSSTTLGPLDAPPYISHSIIITPHLG